MLTICSGPSVNEYTKSALTEYAKTTFTCAVNNSAFEFPCDIIVACDSDWINSNMQKLELLHKPIITRDWNGAIKGNLDLIEVPNDIVFFMRLSGMVAVKLMDSMSVTFHGHTNYVIGLDHTNDGHFYDKTTGNITDCVELEDYVDLNLLNTVNLGSTSKVTAWPKSKIIPVERQMDTKSRENMLHRIRYNTRELLGYDHLSY